MGIYLSFNSFNICRFNCGHWIPKFLCWELYYLKSAVTIYV